MCSLFIGMTCHTAFYSAGPDEIPVHGDRNRDNVNILVPQVERIQVNIVSKRVVSRVRADTVIVVHLSPYSVERQFAHFFKNKVRQFEDFETRSKVTRTVCGVHTDFKPLFRSIIKLMIMYMCPRDTKWTLISRQISYR